MIDEKALRNSTSFEVQAILLLVDEIRELKGLIKPTPNLEPNMKRNELIAEMKKHSPPDGWIRFSNQQMIEYLKGVKP